MHGSTRAGWWRNELTDIKTYVFFLLMLVAFVLSVYNLEYYPRPWFDEGWYLQIPKNLVLYGQYATLSSEGFRPYDTVLEGFPVIYLPIAGFFKLWGIGLVQARAVMVIYFLLACIFIYLVTRTLYGSLTGLIAMVLFIFIKADDNFTAALLMGRQVMVEIPALLFLLMGFYFWLQAFAHKPRLFLVLAGTFMGLTMAIKGQFLLIVPPTLVGLFVIDFLYYRQRRYQFFIIPLITIVAVMLLKYLSLFLILGQDNFSIYLAQLSAASGPQVRIFFSPAAIQTAFKFYLRSNYFVWVVPGLVYAVFLCFKRDPQNIRVCLPWLFVTIWLSWYTVASIGWARYTFPALVVSYIFVAGFLTDLGGFSSLSLQKIRADWQIQEFKPVARGLSVLLLVLLTILNSSRETVRDIVAGSEQSAKQFAVYVESNVNKDKPIETWEWEIAFLTNGINYHHPPTPLLNDLIANRNLGTPYNPQAYDFMQYKPGYIIVGPFAKSAGLYPPDFLSQECDLIMTIGEYDLYKIR